MDIDVIMMKVNKLEQRVAEQDLRIAALEAALPPDQGEVLDPAPEDLETQNPPA